MSFRSSASAKTSLRVLLTFLALVLPCLGPASAWAKKRVVVTHFDGKGDAAQKAVSDVVARDATVVSDATWKKAQKKLRVSGTSAPAVAKAAAEVQADGVVEGAVSRTGVEWGLTLTLFDGHTGQITDTLSIPLRSYKMDADARAAIARDLPPALAKLGAEPTVEVTAPEPAPAPSAPVDSERPPLAEAPPPVKTGGSDDQPETTVSAAGEGRYTRDLAADLEVGMGVLVRNLSFTYAPDLSVNQRPNGYSGSAVPSVLVSADVYPFAFGGSGGALAGLGFGGYFEKVLAIKSKLGTTEYDTSEMRFGGGLRWRFNFGSSATGPSLKLLVGYDRHQFSIDRGAMDLGFADTTYSIVDAGAAGRIPLGTPKVALVLAARYLQVLDAGEISTTNFYGSGSALGVDADLALEWTFLGRAVLRVGGRYQRFAFSFDGNGRLSNNRDGNPATQDVGGATDQYYGGYLTVGYVF
jgi:hypothetical protein